MGSQLKRLLADCRPGFELAPIILVRVPLLAVSGAESGAWTKVRTLLAARRRHVSTTDRFAGPLVERINGALRKCPGEIRNALIELRRAVYGRRRPSKATMRALAARSREARLADWIWRRRDRWDARLQQAVDDAELRSARALARLHSDRRWRQALALAVPHILEQADRHMPWDVAKRRDRMTMRTLWRLAWRAAGRPAPMALFSTTGLVVNDPQAPANRLSGAERLVHASVRQEGPGDGLHESPLVSCAEAERRAWRSALENLALLPEAARAARWHALARTLAAGGFAAPADRADAHSLWFESVFSEPVGFPLERLSSALTTIARFGSSLVADGVPPIRARLAEWGVFGGPRGSMPFPAFASAVEEALTGRFGAEPVASLPMDLFLRDCCDNSADAIVAVALAAGGRIDSGAAATLGRPAEQPLRAAFRARAVHCAGSDGLSIRHWGGEAMSTLAAYARTASHIDPDAEARLRRWVALWPGLADVAIDGVPAAGRCSRLCARRIVREPRVPGDIALTALDVTWRGDLVEVVPQGGMPVTGAIHPGLLAGERVSFATRLLVELTRSPPTVIQRLIEASNRVLAARIAGWLENGAGPDAMALPMIWLEGQVILAPTSFVLRRSAEPSSWPAIEAAWVALERAGCAPRLAEVRWPGVLAEPRIVDLGCPDGIRIALGGEASFAHITPLARDEHGAAEFCIEARACASAQ